jgi:Ring finger domain
MCFIVFLTLIYVSRVPKDLIMTMWLIAIVTLSALKAYFTRLWRLRAIGSSQNLRGRNISIHSRLELIMIEMENIPIETWDGIEENPTVMQERQVTKEYIQTLPHVKAPEDGNCCICMGEIKIEEIITILPCMHKYHAGCVDGWLLIKPSCPVCKTRIN